MNLSTLKLSIETAAQYIDLAKNTLVAFAYNYKLNE